MDGENDNIEHALNTLQVNRIRRMPVVNELGRLPGVISIDDLIAHAAEQSCELSFVDTMDTLKAVCIQQPH